MKQVKVKNKVFLELEKLASEKGLRVSEIVEFLLKNKDKKPIIFPGDFSRNEQKIYCLGILSILLPQLALEDLRELVVNIQDSFPEIFDEIFSQKITPEISQNQEQNQE